MKCKCKWCDRDDNGSRGYCTKHYQQIIKGGKCHRSHQDSNEIIIKDGFAYIIMVDILFNEVGRSIIDKSNIKKVSNIRWFISNKYCCSKNHGRLHRLICNTKDGEFTDHINGNKLDNRKSNLRIATHGENMRNKGITKNNTTGYKGVYRQLKGINYRAQITEYGKSIYLGLFDTKIEAARAYDKKALELFGEFANTNEMMGLYN